VFLCSCTNGDGGLIRRRRDEHTCGVVEHTSGRAMKEGL
jgi:hypothetical protein